MRCIRGIALLACLALLAALRMPLSAGAQAQVVYRYAARDGRPRIALTFDDGPHPAYTPQILDILKEFDVSATFFAVGENVEYYPELAARIEREGHEIGNHTFHHSRIAKMDKNTLKEEILACKRAVMEACGKSPRLFRPPEGVCSETLKAVCEELDMTIVLWSVDTRDWAHTPECEIVENVRCNTHNGSIILMHDFIGKKSPTPRVLRIIIPMLRELGYEFVTVSQLLEAGRSVGGAP